MRKSSIPEELHNSLKQIENFKSQRDWPAQGTEEEIKLLRKLAKRQRPANKQIEKQKERVKSYVGSVLEEAKNKNTVRYLVNDDKSPSSLMKPIHNVKHQRLFPDHITALRKFKMDLDSSKADLDVMKNFKVAGDVYNAILERDQNNEFETYKDVIIRMGVPLDWTPAGAVKKTNDRGVAFEAIRTGSVLNIDQKLLDKLVEEDDSLKVFKPDPLLLFKKSPSKTASIMKRIDQQIVPESKKKRK